MNAVILDTETTGLVEPDVVELAWMGPLHAFSSDPGISCLRFKPRKPITLGAMATHHILDEDLDGQPEWPGSWVPPGEFLIGHHVDFDWAAIGKPDVKRICTLALARRLWPDLDSHSLTALIYHFTKDRRGAREALRGVHSARTDVSLCSLLLGDILRAMPAIHSWERLWAASERARVPTHMPLGKYGPKNGERGLPIEEVRRMDPNYVEWCLRQDFDPYLLKALRGETT